MEKQKFLQPFMSTPLETLALYIQDNISTTNSRAFSSLSFNEYVT